MFFFFTKVEKLCAVILSQLARDEGYPVFVWSFIIIKYDYQLGIMYHLLSCVALVSAHLADDREGACDERL